jgi:hypothetical protein
VTTSSPGEDRQGQSRSWRPDSLAVGGGALLLEERPGSGTGNAQQLGRLPRGQGVDGLTVEPDYLTGVYKNMRHGIVALVFRCHIVSGQPSPTAEASEVAWLTPAQVAELMNEAYATGLLDALQSGPPSVRIHDGVALLPS